MDQNFCNPSVHTQSWYIACRSSDVAETPRRANLGNKQICLFRSAWGQVTAIDDRCAHLGTRLSLGTIVNGEIRCAFHHWCFDHTGMCVRAPGHQTTPDRRVTTYPVVEKWGYVWVWNGPNPLFELPEVTHRYALLRTRTQIIRCHPHVMIANGLDVGHLPGLHGINVQKTQVGVLNEYAVKATWEGSIRSRLLRTLMGLDTAAIRTSFTTLGGNLAFAEVSSPFQFSILFSGKITDEGFCESKTILFLPRNLLRALRVVPFMQLLLYQDTHVLNDIDFSGEFTENDIGYTLYADVVNKLPR